MNPCQQRLEQMPWSAKVKNVILQLLKNREIGADVCRLLNNRMAIISFEDKGSEKVGEGGAITAVFRRQDSSMVRFDVMYSLEHNVQYNREKGYEGTTLASLIAHELGHIFGQVYHGWTNEEVNTLILSTKWENAVRAPEHQVWGHTPALAETAKQNFRTNGVRVGPGPRATF